MWGWFGGGAAQKRKDSPKNAILGLRSQLDMLQKREKYLESQINEQENLARKHVNTNKTGTCKLGWGCCLCVGDAGQSRLTRRG